MIILFDFQSCFLFNNKGYSLLFGLFYSDLACFCLHAVDFFFFRNLEMMKVRRVLKMHFIKSPQPSSLYCSLNIVTLESRHLSS